MGGVSSQAGSSFSCLCRGRADAPVAPPCHTCAAAHSGRRASRHVIAGVAQPGCTGSMLHPPRANTWLFLCRSLWLSAGVDAQHPAPPAAAPSLAARAHCHAPTLASNERTGWCASAVCTMCSAVARHCDCIGLGVLLCRVCAVWVGWKQRGKYVWCSAQRFLAFSTVTVTQPSCVGCTMPVLQPAAGSHTTRNQGSSCRRRSQQRQQSTTISRHCKAHTCRVTAAATSVPYMQNAR